MEEEELGKAGLKADFVNVKPEQPHDGGKGGEGETQVSQSQHGKEQVHGLVERWLYVYDSVYGGVTYDGDDVEAAEWDRNPDVAILKSWDACEDEVECILCAVSRHT